MPLLRLQQPCPRARSTRRAGRAALLADLDHQAALAPDREVVSIFFGGGTPSLMPPETAAALIERVDGAWPVAPDLEITLEANPNSAEAERFAGFAAGRGQPAVARRPGARRRTRCRFLGRAHDRDEALAAIGLAATALRALLVRPDLCPARPEPRRVGGGARRGAGARRRASLALPADDRARHRVSRPARRAAISTCPTTKPRAALFEATQDRLAAAGLPAYEISNHARPGAECRHNLAYWRYEDYVGIGPGAHGRVTQRRRQASRPASAARPRPGSPRSRRGTARGDDPDRARETRSRRC